MAPAHTLILHSGGLRSLVASALARENDEKSRLSLLFIGDGRDNARHRLGYAHRQAEHYAIRQLHQLDLPHLYGHGQGKAPDGSPIGLLVAPQMLLAALANARHHQAGLVVWPAAYNADFKSAARASEQAVLAEQSGDYDVGDAPKLETPLLELSDRQLIELGEEFKAPWALAWSCLGSADLPCRACPGCKRRKAAFAAANMRDPIDQPAKAFG